MKKKSIVAFQLLALLFLSLEAGAQTKPPVEKPIQMDSIPKFHSRVSVKKSFDPKKLLINQFVWQDDLYSVFPVTDGLRIESSDSKKNLNSTIDRPLASQTFGVCVMNNDAWLFVVDNREHVRMYSMTTKLWYEPVSSNCCVSTVVSTTVEGGSCRVNYTNSGGQRYFKTVTGLNVWSNFTGY